jgi:hypothetical protein
MLEGRVIMTRPLACLLIVFGCALALRATPASAASGPTAPVLRGTVPGSPSTETRPAVIGGAEEEIVISRVGQSSGRLGFPSTSGTQHPEYLISIFATACGDPGAVLVGEGTAEQLESEQGIKLSQELPRDTATTLYATQSDPATHEESRCSKGIVYEQVTTAPAAPSFTETVPASPANNNNPALIGTARASSTVSLFTNASCSGAPLTAGAASEFEIGGIHTHVADDTVTVFHATDAVAGLTSACSTSSIEYREVSSTEAPSEENPGGGGGGGSGGGGGGSGGGEAPREQLPNPPGRPDPPKLRTAPSGRANDDTPTVTGRAPGAVRVEIFEDAGCRGNAVAGGPVAQFDAGIPVQVPDNAAVSLYGVAIDGGGDRSSCTPEPVTYVDDSTAPHIRFTSGPGAKTRRPSVLFTFADTTADPTTTFQCRIDHRKWSTCHSPLRLRRLGHRRHTLRVRGADGAGNVSGVAKRRFKFARRG